ETLGDWFLELLADGVVSAVLRRARGTDEAILHPTHSKLRQSLFHLGTPIVVEFCARDFDSGHTDSRIQGVQESVFELSLPGHLHRLLSDRSFLIDFQRQHWQLGLNYRFHWPSPYLFVLNGQQTDRSAVSGAISPPAAVNLNQVLGARLGEPSPGCCTCYAAFVFTLNCRNRRHSATRSLSSSTRLGSASTTTPNAMPPMNSRRCCQVMPALMSIAETMVSSVAILLLNMDTLLFCLVCQKQQGARWNGSLLLSVARVAKELWPGFAWKPDQHFPVSELQVASTLTCIKPCCWL